jgi:hypothetical protein
MQTSMFAKYRVRWEFLTRLCSSVPADPEMIKAWLAAREPRVKPAGSLSIQEINEEVLASIERGEGEADQTFSMLTFQRHEGALVMRGGTVKAHMKDCARVLSAQFVGRIQGERAFSTRVINGVNLEKHHYWLPVRRLDGSAITAPDGVLDKAIHVRGPRGEPLNALKRFEFIEPPSVLEFEIDVLGRSVSATDLDHLFEYGGTHGYAGERGDGEGRYDYTLTRVDVEGDGAGAAHSGGDHSEARADTGRARAGTHQRKNR